MKTMMMIMMIITTPPPTTMIMIMKAQFKTFCNVPNVPLKQHFFKKRLFTDQNHPTIRDSDWKYPLCFHTVSRRLDDFLNWSTANYLISPSCFCLLLGYFTLNRQGVHRRRICLDKYRCCHRDTDVADQACYPDQPQYSHSARPVTALTLARQASVGVAIVTSTHPKTSGVCH